jgi:hypothetical protein
MDEHRHDYKYFSGRDATPTTCMSLERYCTECGSIELYSGILQDWVHVGNMNDDFPEERDTGRFHDPYGH